MSNNIPFGNITRDAFNSEANTTNFAINQKLLEINTLTLCNVLSYNNEKRTCDVSALLNNLATDGSPIASVIQYDVPIMDIVGHGCGIEIEYTAGDIVFVGYNQRDLTNVKNIWEIGGYVSNPLNPASLRKFSIADGIILGRVSNHPPTIKVKITVAGIEIDGVNQPVTINTTADVTTNCNNAKVIATGDSTINCVNSLVTASGTADVTATTSATVTAPTINLDGNVTVTGVLTTATVISTAITVAGIPFATHVHSAGSYANSAGNVTGSSGTV